jgi:tetratricopeptide (TPR) repeat protein
VVVFLALWIGLAQPDGAGARAAYEQAIALEARGDHAAALSLLWAAAGADPADADIQGRLGEALERIGALDAAIDAQERALRLRPSALRTMRALVGALAKAGRGADAVRRAQAWLDASPADDERRLTLALALAEQDVDAAMRTLRDVIARRPAHALAHYNLALLLKRVDRADEAIAAAERALALEPQPETHAALGALHLQRGDLPSAVAALDAATRATPRSADAWLQLGTALAAHGDLRRSADAMRRAIALRPANWSGHAALAGVLARAGDRSGAERASTEAERLRDEERREREAVVITAVGVARLDGDHLAAAVERFRAAIAIAPRYAPAYYHLGRAQQRLGQRDEARAAFATAQQLNPSLVAPQP